MPKGPHLPIDVVLSGIASDGTQGVQAINPD
jgi:hypothetical protein